MTGPTKSGDAREPAREDIRNARQNLRFMIDTAPIGPRDDVPTMMVHVEDLTAIDGRLERALETLDVIRYAAISIGEPTSKLPQRAKRARNLYALILERL